MTMTEEEVATWTLQGKGYEFCNCLPGCTCNFSAFPSSSDGSCQALVLAAIESGQCGDVDLDGVTAAAILKWPKAIHDGGGTAVFVVEPSTTETQIGALAQIFTGQLGGLPWEILGTTYEVGGLVKADIGITGEGLDVEVALSGIGQASGRMFQNPITGDTYEAHIVLPEGFIWTDGNCGVGDFAVTAEGIDLEFKDSNWILYDFDWGNDR